MDLALHGRRALVTGASSGLGLGCARALAAEGAIVTLVARSADKLAAAASAFPSGAIVHTIAADVSDSEAVVEMMARAEAAMGGVDILVANAGGPPPGTFASTPLDAYLPALQLNLLSTVSMCTAAVPAMRSRGWGRVVAITSTTAREPSPNLILSNTARAGLTAYLKTLSREVAADGVTVNSLQPGLHRTDRLVAIYGDTSQLAAEVPTGTIGEADDFGRIAAFLCSDAAKFVNGVAIPVDGGASHGIQ